MTDIKSQQLQLRRRALLLDIVCLALCGVLLWSGSNLDVPQWLLIAGAVVAVALIVAAIVCSAKARKLDVEQFSVHNSDDSKNDNDN